MLYKLGEKLKFKHSMQNPRVTTLDEGMTMVTNRRPSDWPSTESHFNRIIAAIQHKKNVLDQLDYLVWLLCHVGPRDVVPFADPPQKTSF